MTAITAVSAGVKDMADGSLRITFEFDPRYAPDAYALFGSRGRNVAIAALKDGVMLPAQPEPTSIKPKEPKEPIGALCQWCVLRCNEPEFWEFLNQTMELARVRNNKEAAELIKYLIGIDSRKDLDVYPGKGVKFNSLIRHPYQKWLIARGKS
ncbi:hypothetical protein UFOVP607_39 [uncultured Caudovirales phage]|uniref:Uncharacterized protein n=1 Tax=uncultured Caudovirales phage TaxID=2100421 RepID=A0A6J5N3F6_9CAUD|nr:hypothetical protein UFOVP607_39 [uncultured Caudovirales phage]